MKIELLKNDGKWKTLSEFVRSLAGSGSINATSLRKQPRIGGIDSFEMFFRSSGH
jgi:hypothetical protein